MNDELHRRLQKWGTRPAPEHDPGFARRLDADLRSSAYFAPATEPRRPNPRWLFRPGMVMAVLAVLVVVVGAITTFGGSNEPDVLVMGDASGATLTLPGASTSVGATGAELPDGTLIQVDGSGFAVVDGIVLGADARAVVVDGHLELLAPETDIAGQTVRSPTPVATRPDTAPDTPTETDVIDPDPTSRPDPRPTPTVEPRPTDSTQISPTPPDRDVDPPATVRAELTPRPDIVPTIRLRREYLGPQRAELSWTIDDPSRVRKWEIRVRRGQSVHTSAVIRQPRTTTLVVERPKRNRVFFRILAIGADGEVLAESNEVRVTSSESDQAEG